MIHFQYNHTVNLLLFTYYSILFCYFILINSFVNVHSAVLKTTVDMLCDPDYINEKILVYLARQEKFMADTKRTYTYAATYEDFVNMIGSSQSLDELQQMRSVINYS